MIKIFINDLFCLCYTCILNAKYFFQAKVVRSWTKFQEIQELEKVLLWLNIHVPTCTLWIYAKNDAYLMTFFSHTREEFLCCQCMEKGEDEAGWSRSWPQQTILGCWTSQYCALKTTDFLLNYFLLHSYIYLLNALENFVRMFLFSFKI